MNYSTFRNKVQKYPYFRSNIFDHLTDNPSFLRRQLVDWVRKGWVIYLKRGIYTLNELDRKANISAYSLANALYSPSYISLETALGYYGLIPERVYAMTSVSTKKTTRFTNSLGDFIYHNIKPSLFTNYRSQTDEFGNLFFIATPEKALFDFLFFKTKGMKTWKPDILETSFRLQNLDTLNKAILSQLIEMLASKKLSVVIKSLFNFMS